MPIVVTAQDGDTLCGLATSHGHPDCGPVRAEGANSDFLNRPLRSGDRVTIPDIAINIFDGITELLHLFERIGVPLASVRFTHGSPDRPVADDDTLDVLHISNYVTTRAGVPETQTFPNHSSSSFHAGAHADVDAFKVEVHAPRHSGSTIDVTLRALRPILAADGRVTGHEEFSGALRDERALTVTCRKTSSDPTRFRSCYIRLVTDAEDKAARQQQTLLVSDVADGSNGADDKIEILDQRVRVELPIDICQAPASQHRCTALAELPVGENRLRFRLQMHVLRQAPGSAALVNGITIQEVRRHVWKWIRRTYAQADMSLRLVNTEVEAIDPMENLISIFNQSRRLTTGGGRLEVAVNTDPNSTTVTHNTTADETPRQIADGLAAQINAIPNFSATVHDNPVAFNNGLSADIMVTRSDGQRVVLSGERSTDGRTRIGVGRVSANVSTTPELNYLNVGARDHRTLIRNFATDPNCVHAFVIRRFRAQDSAVGYAYPRDHHNPAQFQTIPPVVGCCFNQASTLAQNDREIHTTDHEIGHILCDMVHFSGRHPELMTDEPVDRVNSVGASKRITDRVLPYRHFIEGRGNVSVPLNPCQETRTREAATYIEDWPR